MAASLPASSLYSHQAPYRARYGHDRHGGSQSRRPKNDYRSKSSLIPQPWQHRQYRSPSLTPSTSHTSFHDQDDISRSTTMERSSSTSSTSSDAPHEYHYRHTFSSADNIAAAEVENRLWHLRSRPSPQPRILRKLLSRSTPPDNDALQAILTAVDSIFFDNALVGRVKWKWSSQSEYETDLIGSTALRDCTDRQGVETLIVLSTPILQLGGYDCRLLLSTFLHELIHCFLFVKCGAVDRIESGHTEGFHRIAKCIDRWVGKGELSLCSMMANLEDFRKFRVRDEYEFGYEESRMANNGRWEDWDVDNGCRNGGHQHEGCNRSDSPRYVREYHEVEERYESDNGSLY